MTRNPIIQRLSRRAAVAWRTNLVPMHNARPMVSFTFDDVPASAATTGAAILEAQGVRGSYYVCGGLTGKDWENGRQATREDLVRLAGRGHEIGCHTFAHVSCGTASTSQLAGELEANRAFIKDTLGDYDMATFAYPYGHVGLQSKQLIQQRFAACRGVEAGVNAGRMDVGLLKAVEIPSRPRDERWLAPWLEKTARHNGWLILFTHDVGPEPTPFGCTPAMFARVVAEVTAAGFEVLPVRQALDRATVRRG